MEGVSLDQRFSMLEYFAGKGNVSKEFRNSNKHQVGSFEIDDNQMMDWLAPHGFAKLDCIHDQTIDVNLVAYRTAS